MGMDITWITEQIGVGGGIWNPDNMAKVAAEGITHIIDMQIESDDRKLVPPEDPNGPNIQVCYNPTDDDFEPKPATLLRNGVEFAEKALRDPKAKLYIHCAAGVHRAPMMALAVLGSMGWDLQDARRLIEDRRPVADFADVYVDSVERFLAGGLNHRGR
jgi:protein-tyrosine phosphatase